MSGVDKDVLLRAQEWSELDPNETTSAYVKDLLKQASDENESSNKAADELRSLFRDKRIEFGTAGLRSTMKVGPEGMNDLVVVQAAQGIAKYVLKENEMNDGEKICAVIGYDHRKNPELGLSSLSFALHSALVFQEAGMEVILLNYPSNEGYVATPLVPFTLSTTKNAKLGIMITASHNPKQDAGYKVYWRNGCQIRPPVDKGMADSILENLTPWINYGALLEARKEKYSDPCLGLANQELTAKMVEQYFEAIQNRLKTGQAKLLEKEGWAPPKIAYTAMHGIGHNFAEKAYKTFGFAPFQAISSQMRADPEFPTVPFPNPEEKGALDIAKKFCEENGLDMILANDPDADRLAVAEKNKETGEWTVFTGDQIGTMLGCWLYEKVGKPSGKVS
jgi:phosphomannomutase